MVRNPQALVSLFGSPELCYVLHQVLLFSRLQYHRLQHARRIAWNVIPSVVIQVQVGLDSLPPDMTPHNIVDEVLQEGLLSADRPEHKRLHPPGSFFRSVLSTPEPHLERPAAVPEPVFPGRRNHRDTLIA